jgi:hypothetical protein
MPIACCSLQARNTFAADSSWPLDIALLRRMQSDASVQLQPPRLFDLLGTLFLAFTYRGVP